jgi:hypothetical protein
MLIIVGTSTAFVALCSEIACITSTGRTWARDVRAPGQRDVEQGARAGEVEVARD